MILEPFVLFLILNELNLNLFQNVNSELTETFGFTISARFRPLSSLFSITMEPHCSFKKVEIISESYSKC